MDKLYTTPNHLQRQIFTVHKDRGFTLTKGYKDRSLTDISNWQTFYTGLYTDTVKGYKDRSLTDISNWKTFYTGLYTVTVTGYKDRSLTDSSNW